MHFRYKCAENKLILELAIEDGEKINLCGNFTSVLSFVSYSNALTLKTISSNGWKAGHGFRAHYHIGKHALDLKK